MKSADLTIKITRSSFLWDEWSMRTSFTVIDVFKWSLMDSPVVCILHLHVQTSLRYLQRTHSLVMIHGGPRWPNGDTEQKFVFVGFFVHMLVSLSDLVLRQSHYFQIICLIFSVPLVSNWRFKKDNRAFY